MHSINKNFHKRCTLSDSNGIIHFFWVTTFLMTLNITVVWNSSSISGKEKKKKKGYWRQFYQLFFWRSFSYFSANTISMPSMKQVSRVEESIFLSPNKGFKLVFTISIANSFEIVYIAIFTDFLKINSQLFFNPYWLLLLFFCWNVNWIFYMNLEAWNEFGET